MMITDVFCLSDGRTVLLLDVYVSPVDRGLATAELVLDGEFVERVRLAPEVSRNQRQGVVAVGVVELVVDAQRIRDAETAELQAVRSAD